MIRVRARVHIAIRLHQRLKIPRFSAIDAVFGEKGKSATCIIHIYVYTVMRKKRGSY